MLFTRRERQLLRDAAAFYAHESTRGPAGSPAVWEALLRKLETYDARYRKIEGKEEPTVTRPKKDPKHPWQKAKPHSQDKGYVASVRCRLGGWIVIYDRRAGFKANMPQRWVVTHMPSGRMVSFRSEARARVVMNAVAGAEDRAEALFHADILPGDEALAAERALPPRKRREAPASRAIYVDVQGKEIAFDACLAQMDAQLLEKAQFGTASPQRTVDRYCALHRRHFGEDFRPR